MVHPGYIHCNRKYAQTLLQTPHMHARTSIEAISEQLFFSPIFVSSLGMVKVAKNVLICLLRRVKKNTHTNYHTPHQTTLNSLMHLFRDRVAKFYLCPTSATGVSVPTAWQQAVSG